MRVGLCERVPEKSNASSTRLSPTSSKGSFPTDDSLEPRGGSLPTLGVREISKRRETGGADEEKHVESAEEKMAQSAEDAGLGGLHCTTPILAPLMVDFQRAYNRIPSVRHSCETGAVVEASGYCDDTIYWAGGASTDGSTPGEARADTHQERAMAQLHELVHGLDSRAI